MLPNDLIERLPRQLKMQELRVFLAVLEHRSFRKAAAALHVSQPAVTKAVAGLEEMLEVKLFDRAAKGVEPTVHGLSLAPHAQAIFGELRGAAQSLAIVSSGARGTLHIGTVPTPAKGFLPVAIKQLVKVHPEIFVSVVEAQEQVLAERLRKREIELAIFRFALSHPDEDLRVEFLFEERLCILAGKDHPLAARRSLKWRELLDYPWVMPPADSRFIQYVRRALDEHGMEMPRAVVESSSISFQFGMAVHGAMLSFGLRPDFAFPLTQDVMVRLAVELPVIKGTTGAVRLRTRQPSPLAQQLVGTIRGMLAVL